MAAPELGPGVWAGIASAVVLVASKVTDRIIAGRNLRLTDSLADVEVGQAVRELYADMMADADANWKRKLSVALAESEARCRVETAAAVGEAEAKCHAEIDKLRRELTKRPDSGTPGAP